MQVRKLEFSHGVINAVKDMCKLVFNLQTDSEIARIFGITNKQMEEVIGEIIDSLPDSVFEHLYPQYFDELKSICAREFIFFQVQEKWDDPRYQDDLKKFIHVFSRDIQQRINAHKKFQSTLREG